MEALSWPEAAQNIAGAFTVALIVWAIAWGFTR